MKKKLTQILMLLIAAVSVGSFVSCKDTNEDLYNELRHEALSADATLREALEARLDDLQDQIDALKELESCTYDAEALAKFIQETTDKFNEIDGIDGILATKADKEDLSELQRLVENINGRLEVIEGLDLENRLTVLETAKTYIEKKIEELEGVRQQLVESNTNILERLGKAETALTTAQEDIKELAGKVEQAQLTANEAKTLAEKAEEHAQEALEKAKENAEKISDVNKRISELSTKLTTASDNAEQALKDAAEAAAKADVNHALIDALTERVRTNETNISNLTERVQKLEESTKDIEGLKEKVETTNKIVERLAEKYNELEKTVNDLKATVEECKNECAKNLEEAKSNIELEIKALELALTKRIDENEKNIAINANDIAWIKEWLKEYNVEDLKERVEALEEADKKIDERLDLSETAISEIKESLETIESDITEIKKNIQIVKNRTEYLSQQITKINNTITTITTNITAIQDYLRSQVTGITIQGTYNPMFGSFSIPANIQSNVLVAYYGIPAFATDFPTTDDANYVRKAEVLTAKDWELIGGDEIKEAIKASRPLINKAENGKAYAGKVYVTVNPTSADVTGLQLDLVNTQDVKSPITLTPLKKSYETLQFGFGRADNGFYETDAYIESAALEENALVFDESKLEAVVKEARDKMAEIADNFFNTTGASGDLGNVATRVYDVIHGLRVDQQGLKCPYKDVDGNDAAVYSQYNLAATVLKPLTLASLKDINYATIPGYENANAFLDKIVETLTSHVHILFRDANGSWKVQKLFNGLKIDGIDLADYTDNLLAHFNARLSGFSLNGTSYILTIPGTGSVDILFDKSLGGTYDEANIDLSKASIVIYGTISDLKAKLILPAKGDDNVIAAYASLELTNVTVTNDGGVIKLAVDSSTYAVASVDVTTGKPSTEGYETSLVLSNLTGRNGSVTLPVVTEITGDAQKIVDALRTLTVELNETLEKINNYEGVVDSWIEKFIDQYLRKYLDKVNHTTVYFFNSINRRFGPFLTASNASKGFKTLSTNKLYPTLLDKEGLNLYPTTKNMELIVPIARKHVAVTDVYNEAGKSAQNDNDYTLVTALKKANGGEKVNEVIEGTTRTIQVDASTLTSGLTYEIAYSVLDFEGNISTQKYYVKIK